MSDAHAQNTGRIRREGESGLCVGIGTRGSYDECETRRNAKLGIMPARRIQSSF